jgi:hypothetical protein
MNFNFNFKDMPRSAKASIRSATKAHDQHHTAKSGIKRIGIAARQSKTDLSAITKLDE